MEQNYYDILEVSKNASPEIIEKAYKTLVKKYQCGIMRIVKLAVGYIVFEQKQIVILADEKSAAEWRRLVCRFMYWEIQS